MRVTKTTAWSLGTAVVCIVMLAAAWLLLVEPERAAALEAEQTTVAVRDQNAELEGRIRTLRQQYAELPDREAELAAIREALPERPALTALLAAIDTAAVQAPLVLDGVTVGAAVALLAPVAAEPAADAAATDPAAAEPAADADAAATDAAATDAAATDPATDPAAALGPVLATIPITVSTTGDYFSTAAFLKTLQADMKRALLIESLTLDIVATDSSAEAGAPDTTDGQPSTGQVTTSITGRVYAYVDPQALAAPDSPAPSAAATTGDAP